MRSQPAPNLAAFSGGNDAAAAAITVLNFTFYAATWFGFVLVAGPARWISLVFAGLSITLLFIAGHDAAHSALAKSPGLNRLIAYATFAPTLHPVTSWMVGHNQRHHGFTNLRNVDYVWCPWSPAQYARAGRPQQLLYRFYHTPVGIAFYYPIEIWARHMWHSDERDRELAARADIDRDRFIAVAGMLFIFAGLGSAAVAAGRGIGEVAGDAVVFAVVPFAVFSYFMSTAIFLHHRHPATRWCDRRAEYDAFEAQMRGTVRIVLPKPLEILFHEIFRHTAHHVNSRVPLYRLARAQAALEAESNVNVERFGAAYFLRVLRECQLYDYDTHVWSRCG